MSTQIPYYVWKNDNSDAIFSDGKVKMKNSRCLLLTKNCWESMEIQLNSSGIFSKDFRHCRYFRQIQNDLRERNIEPDKFTDGIIFMSMFNDIDWIRKGNDGICISKSEKFKEYAKRFSQGHWTFFRSWRREEVSGMDSSKNS